MSNGLIYDGSGWAPKGKAPPLPVSKLPAPDIIEPDFWARFSEATQKGPQEQEALLKDLAATLRKKKLEVAMLSSMYDLVEKAFKE